jgi:tryptophanyl-tRNA synthetase
MYLKYMFFETEETEQLYKDYKSGNLLSGDMKNMLHEEMMKKIEPMRKRLKGITIKEMSNSIMSNDGVDVESLIERSGVMSEELTED